MGSNISQPLRNHSPNNYAPSKRTSSISTDKSRAAILQQSLPQQQGSCSSSSASSTSTGTGLSRSKSCSNANIGVNSVANGIGNSSNSSSSTSAGSTLKDLAFHKVSNGNYDAEPQQILETQAPSNGIDKEENGASESHSALTVPLDGGLVGLTNLGNTCYMNSILQCLSHTRPILEFFALGSSSSSSSQRSLPTQASLAKAYASLMQRMWDPTRSSALSPSELKQCVAQYAPRFRGYSQQDSEEFLRYLLEGLHENLNEATSRVKLPPIDYEALDRLEDAVKADQLWQRYLRLDNSVIVKAFVGQLKSTLECTACSHTSVTFDPFWDLALPIPGKSRTTLEACLKLFTAPETLDGNERPTCERCRCRRKCVKRFSIYRLPKILVIHLMRFSGERFKTKLNTLVEYPLELDVVEFLDKKCKIRQTPHYQLYAVSEHSGTPYGGHYTAAVMHAGSARWHRYNDTRVDEASEKSIVSPEGYVLFYAARHLLESELDDPC